MKKTAIISAVAFVIGIIIGGLLIAGFKDKKTESIVADAVQVETDRAGKIEADLADARLRGELLEFHLRLGKLAIDSSRMNYGTAKDEAVEFFSDLQEFADTNRGGKQIRVCRTVATANFQPSIRNTNRSRAIIIAITDKRRRPGRSRIVTTHD